MERKLVLAGIGGQGVIYATKVLSQAGLMRGEAVMASENHGMSQRGGSVLSYIKIGGSQSPLIRRGTADALLAFDRAEAIRNLPYVRRQGAVCLNSPDGFEPALLPRLAELGIGVHVLNAARVAQELGAASSANLVVLGCAAALGLLGFTVDELKAAVHTLGPARAVAVNLRVLEAGAAAGLKAGHERL